MRTMSKRKGFNLTADKIKARKGFNLIEVATVLGVVGLVVGAIWVGASAVQERMKVADTVKTIILIYDRWEKLNPNPSSYLPDDTLLGDFFVTAGILPTNKKNLFNGNWQVASENQFGSMSIKISISGLTNSSCMGIASQIVGNKTMGDRMDRVSAAGANYLNSTYYASQAGWTDTPFPLTIDQIRAMCTNENNTLFLQINPTR